MDKIRPLTIRYGDDPEMDEWMELSEAQQDARVEASWRQYAEMRASLTADQRYVAAERQRQVEAEGWTAEHDDQHRTGQMADAAARYAVAGGGTFPDERTAFLWPWAGSWWKPGDKRRNLVKAGALILAEIERLDRAEPTHDQS